MSADLDTMTAVELRRRVTGKDSRRSSSHGVHSPRPRRRRD